jgi:hypothetical protein
MPKGNREKAVVAGDVRYHGKPCKVCGETEKYTLNGGCCACAKRKCKEGQDRVRRLRGERKC